MDRLCTRICNKKRTRMEECGIGEDVRSIEFRVSLKRVCNLPRKIYCSDDDDL